MPPLVVVPGSHAAEIRAALDDPDALIRHNPRWREAMGTCIHAGVETLNEFDVDGIVLALADQPKITPQILNRLLVTHWATGQPIVASQYADTVGVPVYFSRAPRPKAISIRPKITPDWPRLRRLSRNASSKVTRGAIASACSCPRIRRFTGWALPSVTGPASPAFFCPSAVIGAHEATPALAAPLTDSRLVNVRAFKSVAMDPAVPSNAS
jgi:hypothetical protein